MQLLLICSLFLLSSSYSANTDTLRVHSSIKEVTVFLSGAQITRQAKISLEKGLNHLVLADLPAALKEQTIRLSAGKDVIIRALTKSTNAKAGTLYTDELNQLTNRRQQLQAQIKQQQSRLKVLKQKHGMLLANQDLTGEGVELDIASLKQAIEYFEQSFAAIETANNKVEKQIASLKEQLQEVIKEVKKVQARQKASAGVIKAAIYTPIAKKVQLHLKYIIPNARWRPHYTVRVDGVDKPTNIRYQAHIYQSTGIDWNQVAVTISSAQPQSGSSLPKIEPVYIGFLRRATINMDADLAFKEPGITQAQAEAMPAPPPIRTQLEQGQTTFSFTINTPYSVPSGEEGQKVAIKQYTLPATYTYMAIPKVREQAYLAAKVADWENLHLLGGKANLFLGDVYVGNTFLDLNTLQDTLSFFLGNDESIIVKREQIEKFTEKNFFGNKVTLTKGWKISLQNTKSKPVTIKVIDQVPRSSNEDIQIELQERSGASFNTSSGQLSWNMELQAGETQTVSFSYEIKYPDGEQIVRQ